MMTLDDFRRLELRVGRVTSAERIAGADRLLKLTVDLGSESRTLVGGVAQSYAPSELIGIQVIVATNLAPAMIRGVESQGMMLGASCQDDKALALLTVTREVANGSRVV